MGEHPGSLDAQIDHQVDLTRPHPVLEHPDTTRMRVLREEEVRRAAAVRDAAGRPSA